MALPEFVLHMPSTVEEALALAAPPGSLFMAGGTDVMIQLKQGAVTPAAVISLARVENLRGIRDDAGDTVIGGGTTAALLEESPLLLERLPALVDAARVMATVQIRQRATVAGNLATAAACADLSPVLRALGATLSLRSARGTRDLAMADFFTNVRATVLAPGEILTSVRVAAQPPSSGSAFVKFGYRRGAQIAVASAAAWVVLEGDKVRDLRLVLGAVAPTPLVVDGAKVLIGEKPEGDALEAACAAASGECKPISDIRGSEAYRRAIVAVVCRQAIERAAVRAAMRVEGGRP